MQVCSLPPAWGYEHQGLERFILTFPARPKDGSGPGSRLIKHEIVGPRLKRAKQREDRWAFPFGFFKLVRGLQVSSITLQHSGIAVHKALPFLIGPSVYVRCTCSEICKATRCINHVSDVHLSAS